MIYLGLLGVVALTGGAGLILTARRTAVLVTGYVLVFLGGALVGMSIQP